MAADHLDDRQLPGAECPLFDQCWVVNARREAQAADLVIANHYLLFADLTLREAGFGEVLPGADAIVLDEAHKLPDIAGRFFGQALSSRQLTDLVRDGSAEMDAFGGDMPCRYAAGCCGGRRRVFSDALGRLAGQSQLARTGHARARGGQRRWTRRWRTGSRAGAGHQPQRPLKALARRGANWRPA